MKRILILSILIGSCSDEDHEIKTVEIGGKEWMVDNIDGYHTWDEAIASCPNGFRLPSKYDYQELIDFNSPLVHEKMGYVSGSNTFLYGNWGYYWTSSSISNIGGWAYVFDNSERLITANNKDIGMCVRCIKD